MSVLLTAAKNRNKLKSAKPKKKKRRVNQFNPTPPLSSPETAVWHWELDGEPTTVMFSKENDEVWCNGEIIDTQEGFAEEEDGYDGAVIDFYIMLGEETAHQARIKRMSSGSKEGMLHQLFVDGYMIMEHTGEADDSDCVPIEGAFAQYGDYVSEQPPCYEDVVGDNEATNAEPNGDYDYTAQEYEGEYQSDDDKPEGHTEQAEEGQEWDGGEHKKVK